MIKSILAIGAAAIVVSAAPAEARPKAHTMTCTRYSHGRCMTWKRMNRAQGRRAAYAVGHHFGPRYTYTTYSRLPRAYVTRYNLSPRYRYVYTNGYIYQVDPVTYAITRILNAL
jgi:hypothetical protein